MWPPLAAIIASIRPQKLEQALAMVSSGKSAHTLLMEVFRRSTLGWGVALVNLSMAPHQKKSRGVRSGEDRGQMSLDQKSAMQKGFLAMCAEAPSCIQT